MPENTAYPRYPLASPFAFPFVQEQTVCRTPPAFALTPARTRLDLAALPLTGGEGVTAAVIGAFDAPRIREDMTEFDRAFSLPDAELTVEYLSPRHHAVSSWATEISADAEWLHAMAPMAKIIAVIAADSHLDSLTAAVEYAAILGAKVISMSFGMAEFALQTKFDERLAKTDALLVASAGDEGGQVYYPASSPYVLAVGGCRTYRNGAGNVLRRTAITSGGGFSAYEECPAWQKAVLPCGKSRRAVPDVAIDADMTPGYAVCSLYNGGWQACGGTSVAAPIMAGICAGLLSLTPYVSARSITPFLYELAAKDRYCFDDITVGASGTHRAGAGFDLCTGLGCPKVHLIKEAWLEAHTVEFVEK